MRYWPSLFLITLASALALALGACSPEDDPLDVAGAKKPTPTPTAAGNPSGSVGDGTPSSPTPTPPSVDTPQPTPYPTAETRVAVSKVTVSPATYVILYPPATDPATGLGLASKTQLTAKVSMADGSTGTCQWVDLSEGQVSVTATGLVSTKADTQPGLYEVRARAAEDPNQYVSVLILVKATTALDVTVN